MHVKELSDQRFLFQFFHDFDVKRLVEGSPWPFDNSLLVFACLSSGIVPSTVPLFYLDIWVTVYDIPIGYFSERVSLLFGDFISTFLEYNVRNRSSFSKDFTRIWAKIDIRLLHKRFKKIKAASCFLFFLFTEDWGYRSILVQCLCNHTRCSIVAW